MDVHEAIRTRRSVRDYGDTPIPDEALMKVLEAARLAPSASNQQNWRFIVVKEESRRKGIAHRAEVHHDMWSTALRGRPRHRHRPHHTCCCCRGTRHMLDRFVRPEAGAAGTGRVRRLHGRHRHAPWLSSLSGRNQVAEEAGGHSPLRDGLPIAADAVLDQGRQEDSNDSDQEYAIKQSCAAYRDDSREPLNPIEVQQVCPNECA